MTKLALVFGIGLAATADTDAAPFQNLGFDAGNTNNPSSIVESGEWAWAWGTPEDFLPGWQLTPVFPFRTIGLNARPPGDAFATLWTDQGGWPPVEGRFSFDMLQNSAGQWRLSQTGDVPDGAQAIHFLSYDAHVELRLDGMQIPLVYVPRSGYPKQVDIYGDRTMVNDVYGDVSIFAGRTVELAFVTQISETSARIPDAGLDTITFVIPEPSPAILIGLSALGFFAWCRRRNLLTNHSAEAVAGLNDEERVYGFQLIR